MNRLHLTFFLLVPIFISCSVSKRLSSVEKQEISKQVNKMPASFTGVYLQKMGDASPLYEYNGDKLFTPASNIKILTLYAAKKIIGDSLPLFEFHKEGKTLHIRGNGNPVLLHPQFKYLNENWISEIMKMGVDSVIIHHRETTGKRLGPGWAWDDYAYSFQTEIFGLPLFGNSLWVDWLPTKNLLKLYPDHVAAFAKPVMVQKSEKIKIQREESSNTFTIHIGKDTKPIEKRSIPFVMDLYTASKILEDTLPLVVSYTYDLPDYDWRGFSNIPLDSVYRKMMTDSDNFIAEHLLLAASAELGDTLNTEKVIDSFMKKYFPEFNQNIKWVDGSGLSRYNLSSPKFNTKLMDGLLEELNEHERVHYFPLVGHEGTVKKGFEHLAPLHIYAKSGSLKHHYALTGYFIDSDQSVIIYSIMMDNALTPKDQIVKNVGYLLQLIYDSTISN